MKVKEIVNNKIVVRDMTPEEIAELEALAQDEPTPPPTTEERLEALEGVVLEILGVTANG